MYKKRSQTIRKLYATKINRFLWYMNSWTLAMFILVADQTIKLYVCFWFTTKVPWPFCSREQKSVTFSLPGTFGPRSESSWERKFQHLS